MGGNNTYDGVVKNLLLIGFFGFLVWTFFSLELDPDYIFDRIFLALVFLFFFFFYKKFHTQWYSMLALLFMVMLHSAKLYGNYYFGIEFDVYMHFISGIAITLAVYDMLLYGALARDEKIRKLSFFFFAVFFTAGLGTVLEIVEYAGYANLPPGEGILHFGTGDQGQWGDCVMDMFMNLIGALAAGLAMTGVYWLGRGQERS